MMKQTWLQKIEDARKPFAGWVKQSEKIVKRYRGKRDTETGNPRQIRATKYNALYANVQTLLPALFTRAPTVVASRRHGDRDAVGRVAAEVITRAANHEVERNGLQQVMKQVVQDVLLAGRGVPWIRYEADRGPDGTTTNQRTVVDHVDYRDIVHSEARTWADIEREGWIARRVTLTRAEGRKRFGKKFATVALTLSTRGGRPEQMQAHGSEGEGKYAEVWEIWDRKTRKQVFVAKGVRETDDGVLETRDDPYGLEHFFPCPRPAYATVSNEDLVPTPDYEQYRDQADEVDRLSTRISRLTEYVKVVGAFDSATPQLGTLLGAEDGTMIPVPGLAQLPGATLEGVVRFAPMERISPMLAQLYEDRARAKEVLDEISGVADITRGAGDPNEKATTSRIKASFVTSRLDHRRREIEECTRDIIRLQVEMQVELFPTDKLRDQSGYDLMDEVETLRLTQEQEHQQYAQAVQEYQQAAAQPPQPGPDGQPQPQAQPPQPPPEGDRVELLWQEVVRLLKDERMRSFRVDVESGSTVEQADALSKQERSEFLTAIGNYVNQVLPAMQASPDFAPLAMDFLSYTARTYRIGRSLEFAIEEAKQKITQRAEELQEQQEAQQEAPPEEAQPDPHSEALAQRVTQQAEIDKVKAEGDMQVSQAKIQREQQKTQIEAAKAQSELEAAAIKVQAAAAPPPVV